MNAHLWFRAAAIIVLASLAPLSGQAAAAVARLLAAEGIVHYRPSGRSETNAQAGQELRLFDRVRTESASRATLRLTDRSRVTVGQRTLAELLPLTGETGSAGGSAAEVAQSRPGHRLPLFDLLEGALYCFSQERPMRVQVRTRFSNGVGTGTEFEIRAESDRAVFTVLDGELHLSNALHQLTLRSGEQGVAQSDLTLVRSPSFAVSNVVQWWLYYPGVLDLDDVPFTSMEREWLFASIDAYRQGDLLRALRALPGYPARLAPDSQAARVYFAALLLSVGQVGESRELLALARSSEALRGIVQGLELVIGAVLSIPPPDWRAPTCATEWMGWSYYYQSVHDLPRATEAAEAAVAANPRFSFGLVRVAELQFGSGQTSQARDALDRALTQSPRNAAAWALRGFIRSAENKISLAIEAFDRALEIDSALGNAWLGRGLCRFRRGDRSEAETDLLTAAALEPRRATFRSYLGKAFAESGDMPRAYAQLRHAQQLDPADPTPWLYLALLHFQSNRVDDAVRALENSVERNENRRLYRSRLMLDQDRAVRSANLATVYRDAGMGTFSVRAASRAVGDDYANPSAHWFLANSYDLLRDRRLIHLRYETAALNEFLIARLLSPVGAGSLSPYVSQQEYSKLLEQDGFGLSAASEYLSRGDWRVTGSQYGTFGNSAYSLDWARLHQAGQRPNEDLEQSTSSIGIKQQIGPSDTIFLQVLRQDYDAGDVIPHYDPRDANTTRRVQEQQEPLILGGLHHRWGPGDHTVWLAGYAHGAQQLAERQHGICMGLSTANGELIGAPDCDTIQGTLDYDSQFAVWFSELQQIRQTDSGATVLGVQFQQGDLDTRDHLRDLTKNASLFPPEGVGRRTAPHFQRLGAYGYHTARLASDFWATLGLSYAWQDFPVNFRFAPLTDRQTETELYGPKAGVVWRFDDRSQARASYSRSLGATGFEQSYRLEPTQIAGFLQTYRDLLPESIAGPQNAPVNESWSVGFDRRMGTNTYVDVTAEWLRMRSRQAQGVFGLVLDNAPPVSLTVTELFSELRYDEQNVEASLSQLLGHGWVFASSYRISHAELTAQFPVIPGRVPQTRAATLHTGRLSLLYNAPGGWFGLAHATWRGQSAGRNSHNLGAENFWQFDIAAGYRFARRRAEIRLGVLNLADQDYRLDPLNLELDLPRKRTLALSMRFNY